MGSETDPVAVGSDVTVMRTCLIGATCAITAAYPNGSAASIPEPMNPQPGTWVWTWTIPSSAGGGMAVVTTTCTYLGIPQTTSARFEILGPLPGWRISASMPSSRLASDAADLVATVTIDGNLPVDGTHPQDVSCNLILNRSGVEVKSFWITEYPWHNGDGPLTLAFAVGVLGPEYTTGWTSWTIHCTNVWGDPVTSPSDQGQILFT